MRPIETLDGGTVPANLSKQRIHRALRLAVSKALYLGKAISNLVRQPQVVWANGIDSEVTFWDSWLATKGGDYHWDFCKRLDPDLEVYEPVSGFINSADCKILDVGAGPLTMLGKKWKGQLLDITAVDPLAWHYDKLLAKHNVMPPVRTQQLEAEKLTEKFSSDTFDIVNAQNCLDHSYNPIAAIEEMVKVAKPGGAVTLVHGPDEGAVELYRGLHQWNFRARGGEFLIASPGRPTVNMSQRLSDRATVKAFVRPSDGSLVVVIAKKAV